MQNNTKIALAIAVAAVVGIGVAGFARHHQDGFWRYGPMGMMAERGFERDFGHGQWSGMPMGRGMGFGMMPGFGAAPAIDFAALDADKDGKITPAELDAHRAGIAGAIDANKDGKLSAEEIAANAVKTAIARADAMAVQMVERMDTDGDKLLSAAELVTPAALPMPFARLDTNGDGVVTKDEADATFAMMPGGLSQGWGMMGPGMMGFDDDGLPQAPGGSGN